MLSSIETRNLAECFMQVCHKHDKHDSNKTEKCILASGPIPTILRALCLTRRAPDPVEIAPVPLSRRKVPVKSFRRS